MPFPLWSAEADPAQETMARISALPGCSPLQAIMDLTSIVSFNYGTVKVFY